MAAHPAKGILVLKRAEDVWTRVEANSLRFTIKAFLIPDTFDKNHVWLVLLNAGKLQPENHWRES